MKKEQLLSQGAWLEASIILCISQKLNIFWKQTKEQRKILDKYGLEKFSKSFSGGYSSAVGGYGPAVIKTQKCLACSYRLFNRLCKIMYFFLV